MPRAIWKGHLSFGLVDVPVRLYSATRRDRPDSHLIDRRDGAPVGHLKINKDTGREVRHDEIARAYEVDGEEVVVEDADLEAIAPASGHSVDIEDFVRREDISPVFFDKPYFLAPDEGAERSYALLREVIERTERVGIARVVLRKRERLCAVTVHDGALTLNLLRYWRELRDPAELDLPAEDLRQAGVSDDAVDMAVELIERKTREWAPQTYRDQYQDRLLELIEQKARPERPPEVTRPEQAEPTEAQPQQGDLTERLRRSIDRG
jgi:DNA end-binding protein Ku